MARLKIDEQERQFRRLWEAEPKNRRSRADSIIFTQGIKRDHPELVPRVQNPDARLRAWLEDYLDPPAII